MPALASELMIDRVLVNHDHVNSNIAIHRTRALNNLQNAVSEITYMANWTWRIKTSDIEFSTDGQALMPARFSSMGPAGMIVIEGERRPMRWVAPHLYHRMKAAGLGSPGIPVAYTELNIVEGQRAIGCWPLPAATTNASATFQISAPTITDDDPGGLGDEDDTIPGAWHETAVYELLVWYQMKDKANIQTRTDQREIVDRHMKSMREEERGGRADSHRIVPFNPYRR